MKISRRILIKTAVLSVPTIAAAKTFSEPKRLTIPQMCAVLSNQEQEASLIFYRGYKLILTPFIGPLDLNTIPPEFRQEVSVTHRERIETDRIVSMWKAWPLSWRWRSEHGTLEGRTKYFFSVLGGPSGEYLPGNLTCARDDVSVTVNNHLTVQDIRRLDAQAFFKLLMLIDGDADDE